VLFMRLINNFLQPKLLTKQRFLPSGKWAVYSGNLTTIQRNVRKIWE
jgi:hypothetical protein